MVQRSHSFNPIKRGGVVIIVHNDFSIQTEPEEGKCICANSCKTLTMPAIVTTVHINLKP